MAKEFAAGANLFPDACALAQFIRNVSAAYQQHNAPCHWTGKKTGGRSGARRLGQHVLLNAEMMDRLEHLFFADQHDIVNQVANRRNILCLRHSRG